MPMRSSVSISIFCSGNARTAVSTSDRASRSRAEDTLGERELIEPIAAFVHVAGARALGQPGGIDEPVRPPESLAAGR